jgi:hypothetical protein
MLLLVWWMRKHSNVLARETRGGISFLLDERLEVIHETRSDPVVDLAVVKLVRTGSQGLVRISGLVVSDCVDDVELDPDAHPLPASTSSKWDRAAGRRRPSTAG